MGLLTVNTVCKTLCDGGFVRGTRKGLVDDTSENLPNALQKPVSAL